jgi:hypothetical protein
MLQTNTHTSTMSMGWVLHTTAAPSSEASVEDTTTGQQIMGESSIGGGEVFGLLVAGGVLCGTVATVVYCCKK